MANMLAQMLDVKSVNGQQLNGITYFGRGLAMAKRVGCVYVVKVGREAVDYVQRGVFMTLLKKKRSTD